ncbi:GHMP family kinase ATP-binding protein [Gimesia aquarii]|uniref:D-glycero-alpha-D-manno-heptose 7-phosphate kinase n=1 Tax=Gimesia aquarii TaxID=2527964 RepID=A0A517W3T9_9PLAN|nr:kinase [Gimesia aquarii]QDT99927.1 D-glycero-alpha-D-manno-heptose 7-phosphate kinase [Gimesia aquarii]
MIICRTPFRVSFFGGGTDYPAWYRENGGAVLSTSIDKYCYITCRKLPPFFEHKHRIAYSKVENVKHADEIEHPAVRAVIKEFDLDYGIEIHNDADLPARSGLGSSSSFSVGLINALTALQGLRISKPDLNYEAIRIEQDVIGEDVGSQDQTATCFGGFNIIEFKRNDEITVSPVLANIERIKNLNSHLLLFFTGFSRIAASIAKSQIANMSRKHAELTRMREMVDNALDLINATEWKPDRFGQLLHEGWKYKRGLSEKVSNDKIDKLYETAMEAGAFGGKVIGAGGGGFMLFCVPPERQENVKHALSNLIHVPFDFDNTGSQIIYYQP